MYKFAVLLAKREQNRVVAVHMIEHPLVQCLGYNVTIFVVYLFVRAFFSHLVQNGEVPVVCVKKKI